MPVTKRHMSKVREETYKEEELRRTLEEINRDARGGYRDKKARDGRASGERPRKERAEEEKRERRHRDEKEKRHKGDGDEDRRRPRGEGDDRRRSKDDGGERRRHREEGDDRRRHKEEGDDRRRHKEEGDDRRRHREEGDDRRRHREEGDEKRRHKQEGDDRRRHREEGDEKRRHRDEKAEDKRHHRDERDDRRKKDEKSRHRDEGEEKRRQRDERDKNDRRHRDREETEEEREKRKREERRKRKEEEERDERRRRKDKEETEEEREKRKKEERRKRKEEEERKKEEEKRRLEMERKMAEEKEEEDNYDDYEDDFENYDDDFENDESSSGTVNEKNKEMADILRAMSAENDHLGRSKKNRKDSASSSTSGEVVPAGRVQSGQQKYFINFVSARTRQVDAAVSSRTRQRSRELLRLIHLDSTTHDMFEMGELEAYELYMRGCGCTAANQVACQTNDDAMEREVQCEPIERRTLWTLHPPEDLNAVGFASGAEEERRPGGFRGLQEQLAEEEAARGREAEARQLLHSAPLRQSLRLVLRLLEEESRPLVAAPPEGACTQLSNGYTALACPPELRHLPCRFAAFSPTQSNLLLTLHSHGARGRAGPAERDVGYALVWNVTVPQEVQEVLEAPARATCAVFSPLSASLVFLGLVDGSLAVWDLREPPAWHPTDAKGRRRRAATYSTAAAHLEAQHVAPVVDLRALPGGGASFQLASLDAAGAVLLWVTTQLAAADPAGSEADFGLRPGGRVRLSRTAELHAAPLFLSNAFAPSFEAGAFLIGSELGEIHHVGRHGSRLCPRLFRPAAPAAAVRSLDLSPFREPYFLAGYADGAVRIFHCHHAQPLLEFAAFGAEGGAEVCWSRSRPALFFALDAAGGLFTWDLTRSEHRHVHRESPGGRGDRKALRMALSCDFSATRQGDRGRRPQAAFVFAGPGDFLEVHEMAESVCVGDLDETFRVANLLNSFI